MEYKTPGVYITEIRTLPPSVAAVETAIPAFIGYTEKAKKKFAGDLVNEPHRIRSLLEHERYFGKAQREKAISVVVDTTESPISIEPTISDIDRSKYMMYYAMQAFFANGGGPCYVVSVGTYGEPSLVESSRLLAGLAAVAKKDEVTLIVYPDGPGLDNPADYYAEIVPRTLTQCRDLQDRFAILDVWINRADRTVDNVETFRNSTPVDPELLKYGAVYYPNLRTTLDYRFEPSDVVVTVDGGAGVALNTLELGDNALYNRIQGAIRSRLYLELAPSPCIAGVYARVDNVRGVWKAPANLNIQLAVEPTVQISHEDQKELNVHGSGKSINAIRAFAGRGAALVWGARTLLGNDNEWRYVSVRRFYIFVEESVKKATYQFVFEPNDRNTWTRVKSMITNFLTRYWRAGALQGATPEDAFYVKVGLNETMDAVDILEGRMIVEIGMAVVKPAEFIVLKFTHMMVQDA